MNFIERETLKTWLDAQTETQTVVAPKEVDGVLLYRPINNSSEIIWDYIKPVLSIKDVFFPSTETLLTIEKQGQSIELTEVLPQGWTLVLGVRSCDVRGLETLDALFLDTPPEDTYYADRRKKSVLIGTACKEMGETCFCTRVGGAPNDPSGMDVMLTETTGGFAVEAYTPKGRAVLQDLPVEQVPDEEPVSHPQAETKLPQDKHWPRVFKDGFWETISERCLSCRICAYVCPTCRCFDVRDEPVQSANGGQKFERIRCWDSCAGEVYRQLAGGHNSRAAKADRLRNRFFCKFYYYPEQYGPTACTGCGRCIDSCPVDIDITDVLDHLMEVSA